MPGLSLRTRILFVLGATAAVSTAASIGAFVLVNSRIGELRDAVAGSTPADTSAQLDQLWAIQLGVLVITVVLAVIMLIVSAALLHRWVIRPLGRMAAVARRVDAGETALFRPILPGELGQLGRTIEGLQARMAEQGTELSSDARQATVLNRFTDAATYADDEAGLAGAVLHALLEIGGGSDGLVHVTTPSHDRAVRVAHAGSHDPGDITVGELDNCPGVRRGALYTIPVLDRALSVLCPVFPATTGTLACAPLTAAGEVVGVAHLYWPEPRSVPLPVRTAISRVTEQAGMTIANRRLLSDLRSQTLIDAHTGLANARAFDEALERTMAGRRNAHEVAVLLVDVDDFAAFNDRNGTPAGDDALRFFARMLDGCLRDADVAGRYGPEEFAVMLPEMSIDQAMEVAERIRGKAATTTLPVGREADERLLVSIGIAVAPHDGTNRIALLRAADKALHEAKIAGRNRVVPATDLLIEDEPDGPSSPKPEIRGHMVLIARDVDAAKAALPTG